MTEQERSVPVAEKPPVAARAPYNFVPLSEEVLFRYDDMRDLPPFGTSDPELKSGEIFLTLTADSPVFFGGSGRSAEEDFFYQADGRCAVPATALRGEVRSSLRILTCGRLQPGVDYFGGRLLYSQAHLPKEGKVRRPMAETYTKVLGIDTSKQIHGKNYIPTPENVRAGYLHRCGDAYVIRPAEHAPFWMKQTHPVLRSFLSREAFFQDYRKLRDEETVSVYYRTDDTGLPAEICRQWQPGMKAGMLLYKKNRRVHSYLFPGELAHGEELLLSNNDIKVYEQRNRRWLMPKKGSRQPVFYLRQETEEGVRIYFGHSWFPYIAFRYPVVYGLPAAHRTDSQGVDYVSALFGKVTRRSRVFFGDCKMESAPAESLPQVRCHRHAPKMAYYTNYVLDKKNYNDPDFRLRGYKQYWLKDPDWQALAGAAQEQTGKNDFAAESRTRYFVPLPAGTRFCGSIRFRNLHPDELGALLWALKLEDGCFHSMGRARADGFGRMKAEISRLVCYDVKAHYQSLLPAQTDETERVAEYIEAYQAFAAARLSDGKRPEEREEIRDFFYIRKTVCSGAQVAYMSKKECGDVKIPLPTIRDIREGRAKLC